MQKQAVKMCTKAIRVINILALGRIHFFMPVQAEKE